MKKTKRDAYGHERREVLTRNLDEVFNRYIRKRDGGCILSGDVRNVGISHLISQTAYPNTRWDEKNAVLMSNRLHKEFHETNCFRYLDWFLDKYGQEELDALKKRAFARYKTFTLAEIVEITNQYVKKTLALPHRRDT